MAVNNNIASRSLRFIIQTKREVRVHQAAAWVLTGFLPEATHPKFGNTFIASNPADLRKSSTSTRV
jgi:hypothetical protein